MKNFIIIFFLATYLFSSTQLSELLKISTLFEHFAEHAAKDKTVTVWSFLSMHYSSANDRDGDYDRDMELPYKSMNNLSFTSITICTPIEEFQFSNKQYIKLCEIPSFKYNFSFSSNYHSAIWQPPKSC